MPIDLDVASTITAVGGAVALVLRAITTRGRSRKDLERRVEQLEAQLLEWATWAHDARVQAASSGCRLPAIPRPRNGSETTEREAA
jgi:hypothetical protein